MTLSAAVGKERLIHGRDLLRELVVRDLKVRYKRTLLGAAWSLFNPLAQLLVFSFLFSKVVRLDQPHYPSFVFCGLLSWAWFQSSLVLGAESFTLNRELIRRPGFSPAVLPAVRVCSDLIHFLLALPLLLLFVTWGGPGVPAWGALVFLPLVIGLQFLLSLSLVYLFATLHVTFRDTQYLLGVFLTLFFYLTPVFYDVRLVPAEYALLYRLNPLAVLLDAYRTILLGGVAPDLAALAQTALGIGVLLGTSVGYFSHARWHFWEEL